MGSPIKSFHKSLLYEQQFICQIDQFYDLLPKRAEAITIYCPRTGWRHHYHRDNFRGTPKKELEQFIMFNMQTKNPKEHIKVMYMENNKHKETPLYKALNG